jgi:hypothetical protein
VAPLIVLADQEHPLYRGRIVFRLETDRKILFIIVIMKDKIKDSWNIFNNYFKYGWWFWITVAIGIILFAGIVYLGIEFTLITFFNG